MTLTDILKPLAKPYVWGALAILAVVILTLGWCSEREERQKARADRDMAQGRTTSAVEAIEAIGELGERGQATQKEVQNAQEAIRAETDPSKRDAVARSQLCRLQNRPDC